MPATATTIRKDETWPQRTVQKGGERRSGPRGADRTSVFGSRRQGAHRSADIRRGLAARSLSVNAIPARQPRRTHNALEGGATYMQSVLAGFVLLLYKLLNSLDIFPSSGNSTISRFLSANARTSDCSRCNSLAASRMARQPRRTHNALEGGATYMQSVLAGFVLLLYKLLNSLDIFPSSGNSTISRFLSANARTSDCSRCNSLAASRISSCLRVGVLVIESQMELVCPYVLLGVALWAFVYAGGLHATLARRPRHRKAGRLPPREVFAGVSIMPDESNCQQRPPIEASMDAFTLPGCVTFR